MFPSVFGLQRGTAICRGTCLPPGFFEQSLKYFFRRAMGELRKNEPAGFATLEQECPLCNASMVVRIHGRFRTIFLGCTRYPECRGTRYLDAVSIERLLAELGQRCLQCGGPIRCRSGTYGSFLACSCYPSCLYTIPTAPLLSLLKRILPEHVPSRREQRNSNTIYHKRPIGSQL